MLEENRLYSKKTSLSANFVAKSLHALTLLVPSLWEDILFAPGSVRISALKNNKKTTKRVFHLVSNIYLKKVIKDLNMLDLPGATNTVGDTMEIQI